MRCPSTREYFIFKEPGRLYRDGDIIEADTDFVRCVLLVNHVGDHRALVPDKGPVLWPDGSTTKEYE